MTTDGQVWWVRAISTVGLPSVIAVYLVWLLAGQVLTAIDDHATHSESEMRQQIDMLRQICINTAPTPAERAGCFPR